MARLIHPSAIVDGSAQLGEDVEIGPYAVVGAGVQLGPSCTLHAHAVVLGPTVLGRENVIHPFAVLGGAAQLKRRKEGAGSPMTLTVGDRNVFREHVTIHRAGGEGEVAGTRVGSDNLFMVGAHVAHDAVVGSHVTLANGVQLAGHAVVEDYATFGGLSGVAQFVRVGESAFVAAGAMCERDVPPFVIVQGDRAKVRALNVVGLRRREVSEESMERLWVAFRQLFVSTKTRAEALSLVDRSDRYVAQLVQSLRK